ncbi:MAG: 4Fe-4S dicluster domain-containing protein [Gemmatimonadales bacterium]|jgi:formate dehydrogenase iron-sulfur subunit
MIEHPAILIDTTRCVGCEECVAACKREHGLGPDRLWPGQQRIDSLSATRRVTVLRRPDDRFVVQQCRHCLDPACVSACLVGAMQKTPEGPVIYDPDKCMGCRYCLVACPFGIPRYDWDRPVPFVHKCTMCYRRLRNGREPACVEACPEDATVFGSRPALLAEAHRRIDAEPDRYLPCVAGEHEVGGTSVLYLSDTPLDFLSWRQELGTTPLPQLTWASLEKVPPVILLVSGLMAGVHWVIGRRMKRAAEAAGADPPTGASPDPGGGDA